MAEYPTPYLFVYDVFMRDCVKHVQIAANVKSWARAEMDGAKLYQLVTGLPVAVEDAPAPEPAAGAPPAAPAKAGKIYGEVMTFLEMDDAMNIVDAQEAYRVEVPQKGPLTREVREVTITATGEKVKAMVYLFPKEKFNAVEMRAVHAHGGDWRKFVMMPRFDGYQH